MIRGTIGSGLMVAAWLAGAAPQETGRLLPPPAELGVSGWLTARRHPSPHGTDLDDLRPALVALYQPDYESIWCGAGSVSPRACRVLAAMEGAAERGLDPADYDLGWLRARAEGMAPGGECAVFDTGLSLAYVRFLSHAATGRVDPRRLGFDYRVDRRLPELGAAIRAAIDAHDPAVLPGLADALEPSWGQFRRLKAELGRYRSLAAQAVFPRLSAPRPVAPGDAYEDCAALAQRLKAFGDLAEDVGETGSPPASETRCSPFLGDAIRRFQARHGIAPDGILGPQTFRQLNVAPADRVRQIELALERLRWLPRPTSRFVVVNVPAYRLVAFATPQDAGPALQMPVIVGRASVSRTPLFAATMEDVVFRPYWYPPESILRYEILPRLEKDPGWLAENDMELIVGPGEAAVAPPLDAAGLEGLRSGRLRLRQRPGPRNSLGLMKFDFPNDHTVYMHGTPAPLLFERARRDFSHGCVRLADPAGLAEFVIAEADWSRGRIEAEMAGSRTFRHRLIHPVSVFVFYTTTVVRADGTVSFFDDLYGEDRALRRALARSAGKADTVGAGG